MNWSMACRIAVADDCDQGQEGAGDLAAGGREEARQIEGGGVLHRWQLVEDHLAVDRREIGGLNHGEVE
jgi:hypothetical protein